MRAQNIVSNGGFEMGTFSGWGTNSANGSGTVSGAGAHTGSGGVEFSELIFMGDEGTEDTMSQTLTTQAGTNYVLSFWANGMRQSSMGVNWNGVSLMTASIFYPDFSPLTSGWTNFQFVAQATGASTVLTFTFKASPGANNSTSLTALDDVSVIPAAINNQMKAQAASGGNVKLTYIGPTGVSNALDRTFSLRPVIQWTPLSTNVMGTTGSLIITTNVVATTNNFWRIRVVQ